MGFYSFLGFLRPAIFIFLLPVYLRVFTEAQYATYNLMMDFALISSIVVSFKLNTAMLTNYYDYIGDEKSIQKYLSSNYSFSLILGLISLVGFLLCGPFIFDITFKSDVISFFPLGLVVVLFTIVTEMNLSYITYLKNKKDIIRYTAVLLTQIIGVVILQLIFIVWLKRGVLGALEGIFIGNILVTLLVVYFERKILTFQIDMKMVKSSLRFSIPLIPYLVIYWFLSRGGKIFLERYSNLEEVAVFSLLAVISGMIVLGVEAVVNGIRPFLFEQFSLKEKADKHRVALLSKMTVNLPLVLIPFIVLISTHIHFLTSKPIYFRISDYITLACFVFYLLVWARLFYQQLIFTKASNVATVLSFVSLLALLFLFVKWIPLYGINGVLYATCVANIVLVVLFHWQGQKKLFVRYEYLHIFLIPLIVFASLFGLEYGAEIMGWSSQTFGLMQFVFLLIFIFILNRSSIKDYKRIFLSNNKSSISG